MRAWPNYKWRPGLSSGGCRPPAALPEPVGGLTPLIRIAEQGSFLWTMQYGALDDILGLDRWHKAQEDGTCPSKGWRDVCHDK
jgi:hypothetical protein